MSAALKGITKKTCQWIKRKQIIIEDQMFIAIAEVILFQCFIKFVNTI